MTANTPTPPLVEAVCEFRFPVDGNWDWTIPGLFFDQVKDDFSAIEQVAGTPFEIQPGKNAEIFIPIHQGPGIIRFRRPDESALVQLGPGMFAVNHFPKGYSWSAYLALIQRLHSLYSKIAKPKDALRIALRYINRAPLPDPTALPETVLTVAPVLPEAIASPIRGFYQRFELSADALPAVVVLQAAIQGAELQRFVMVDIDVGTPPESKPLEGEAVWSWLDAAHDRVKTIFRSTLTAEFRSGLGL